MRTPLGTDAFDLFRCWAFTHSVRFADGVLNPEVQFREYVGPAEPEHEKHLSGPSANAFYLDEMRDEVVVGHVLDGIEREIACGDLQ